MTPLRALAAALAHRADLEPSLLQDERLTPLLTERRLALRLENDHAYIHHALHDEAELDRLRDLIAVPETWLFRYAMAFELLRERLTARASDGAGPSTFQALSLPCATGAEPLSIAATALASGFSPAQVRVLAVDTSTDALAIARTGRLRPLAAREGVPTWADPWFTRHADHIQAHPELLRCIEWIHGAAPRVLDQWPAHTYDAVFCRNLAIYLGTPARRAIGQRLLNLLRPDGLLFLGHTEPPGIFGLKGQVTPLEPLASFAFASRCAEEPPAAPRPAETHAPQGRIRRGTAGRTPGHGRAGNRGNARAGQKASPGNAAGKHPSEVAPAARSSAPSPVLPPLADVRAAADAGRLEQALHMGDQLLRHGDRSCELLLLMGTAYAALGQTAHAENMLRQVVYLEPGNTEALLQLATLAEQRGDHRMSERYRHRAAHGRQETAE